MEKERIKKITQAIYKEKKKGKYIFYWMQQSQRVEFNHALAFAITRANELSIPLLVGFALTEYPEGNERHYAFMLEGLKEVEEKLEKMNIGFTIEINTPNELIRKIIADTVEIIFDKGYLKIQRKWREEIVESIKSRDLIDIYEVESDIVVPIEVVSKKSEIAARTIRPKIRKELKTYLNPIPLDIINNPFPKELMIGLSKTKDIDLYGLKIDKSIKKTDYFLGGTKEAQKKLSYFLDYNLHLYSKASPEIDAYSELSPYLHFGQISPIDIYFQVEEYYEKNKNLVRENVDAFLEQLVIRRELAFNYVYYTDDYDSYDKMTDEWAYITMKNHKNDIRQYVYSIDELVDGKTHDIYWNGAMEEMKITGKMNNYMRMYWGKKIIEWTSTYEEAYNRIKDLNNKYFIDGRDANSYAGIAWCFGKHDHGWKEREIFGKLRYMNDKGLERKFKMEKYIERINEYEKKFKS